MDTPPRTFDRTLLAGAAWLVALASLYAMRLADADLWGHLLYGRLFLDSGGLIAIDPYAYTTAGCSWSTHEYLAQMTLALAYQLGGTVGLQVLKCLLGGAAIFLMWQSLRLVSRDPRLWAPLLALTA